MPRKYKGYDFCSKIAGTTKILYLPSSYFSLSPGGFGAVEVGDGVGWGGDEGAIPCGWGGTVDTNDWCLIPYILNNNFSRRNIFLRI